jgi:hypothetical protein
VTTAFSQPGSAIMIVAGAKRLEAEVVTLPIYKA